MVHGTALPFQVKAAVRLAKAALQQQQCVVIGLQSTGESRINAHIKQNGFDGRFVSPAKGFLRNVVTSLYKTGGGFACGRPPFPALVAVQQRPRMLQTGRVRDHEYLTSTTRANKLKTRVFIWVL